MTIRYLSTHEVADRLGLAHSTIANAASTGVSTLPEPDAVIGRVKGWLPSTIDVWDRGRRKR